MNGAGLVPGMKAMQVRCKFGQLGQGEGQFNSPHGFCLGRNEEIVVADTHNNLQTAATVQKRKFQQFPWELICLYRLYNAVGFV